MNFSNDLVLTTLGELPQRDLQVDVLPAGETDSTWTYARECRYIGSQYPERKNELVRRDVWVTLKRGQTAEASGHL